MEPEQNRTTELQHQEVSSTSYLRGVQSSRREQGSRGHRTLLDDIPVQVDTITSTVPFNDRISIEIIERLLE